VAELHDSFFAAQAARRMPVRGSGASGSGRQLAALSLALCCWDRHPVAPSCSLAGLGSCIAASSTIVIPLRRRGPALPPFCCGGAHRSPAQAPKYNLRACTRPPPPPPPHTHTHTHTSHTPAHQHTALRCRLQVYVCLVEGCPRKFCTVEERKQHLQVWVCGWLWGCKQGCGDAAGEPVGIRHVCESARVRVGVVVMGRNEGGASSRCERRQPGDGVAVTLPSRCGHAVQDHHKFPRHFHFDRLHLRCGCLCTAALLSEPESVCGMQVWVGGWVGRRGPQGAGF
jgi:hypothetical protein